MAWKTTKVADGKIIDVGIGNGLAMLVGSDVGFGDGAGSEVKIPLSEFAKVADGMGALNTAVRLTILAVISASGLASRIASAIILRSIAGREVCASEL